MTLKFSINSVVIPGELAAIPPEADQPQAEASATRNPGNQNRIWIPAFAGLGRSDLCIEFLRQDTGLGGKTGVLEWWSNGVMF